MTRGKLPMHDLPSSHVAVQIKTKNSDYLIQVDSLTLRLWFTSTNSEFDADSFGDGTVVMVDDRFASDMFFLVHQMMQSTAARCGVLHDSWLLTNTVGNDKVIRFQHTLDSLTGFMYDKLVGGTMVIFDPATNKRWQPTTIQNVKVHWFARLPEPSLN